jgi:hypothetical protein
MYQLLFKNRFNTLVFVAIMLFSVRILVGTPDDSGAIDNATAKFGETQPQAKPAPVREVVHAEPETEVAEFTPDEELIDDASGDDVSGWSAEPDVDGGESFGVSEIIAMSEEG